MNKYQKFVKQVHAARRMALLFMEFSAGILPHKESKKTRKDIEKAWKENEESDREMEEHFAYSVWESIKLGLPF